MPTTTEYAPSVQTHPNRMVLGERAGSEAAAILRDRLAEPGTARIMLAAAPSQEATLRALSHAEGIDWSRVVAFHMDDYLGLPADAPQGFGNWLERHFVANTPGLVFERMRPDGDPGSEAERYAAAMGDEPFDLVLLGLGVNGHLAFNDPPADFDDPRAVRVVQLDAVSRQQQVDEGHFPDFESVPPRALSVTIPRLLDARVVIASVPGSQKRQAVIDSLERPIGGEHPGTALRRHPRVHLHVDVESAPV
ncbi:6-phosphogluconolactonase [Cnuibacter physcomitrellae]|uniref:6-phosphogluconolactonase n=1 Tax=Cnuibacter physcomitrellae TaxID=1619308 RepID=UPI0021761D4B|nr:6-phosphogluconolactonase [Cnuibacter physcomitrellae]MCS5497242.1 6-phosphogluconolactonase [Cnuibacter physcomitrellae]